MRQGLLVFGATLAIATVALAHTGVKNPTVLARMHTMLLIGDATKVLGEMAKGTTPFDAAKAEEALASIAAKAADVPALFKAQEDDPKSEALPAIWEDYEDFSAKAKALEIAASEAAGSLTSVQEVGAALQSIGQTCKGCHSQYRE